MLATTAIVAAETHTSGRTIAANDVLPKDYPVVLKIMSDELAGEVTARKRFVKEAQILAKLRPGGVFADVKCAYDAAALRAAGARVWRL